MRQVRRVDSSEDARARARVLAHFEDNPTAVFYSRQLKVMFEQEYFHWATNRAIRLVEEGRILTEVRKLDLGSEISFYGIEIGVTPVTVKYCTLSLSRTLSYKRHNRTTKSDRQCPKKN
jgi:hypothetical protein